MVIISQPQPMRETLIPEIKPWQMTQQEYVQKHAPNFRQFLIKLKAEGTGREKFYEWSDILGHWLIRWSRYKPTYSLYLNNKPIFDARTIEDAAKVRSALVHKSIVQQALLEGKPVPSEVLKDYPDLTSENKTAPVVMEAPAPKRVFRREGKLEINPLLVQAFGITSEEIMEVINESEQPEEMGDMFAFLSDYATLSDPRTRLTISGDKLDFMVADMKRRMGHVFEFYRKQATEYKKHEPKTARLLLKVADRARQLYFAQIQSRSDKIAFIDAVIHFGHTTGPILPVAFGISDYGRKGYWVRKLLAFLRSQPGMVREAVASGDRRMEYRLPLEELKQLALRIQQHYRLPNIYLGGSQSPKSHHYPERTSDIDLFSYFNTYEENEKYAKTVGKDVMELLTFVPKAGLAGWTEYKGRTVHLSISFCDLKPEKLGGEDDQVLLVGYGCRNSVQTVREAVAPDKGEPKINWNLNIREGRIVYMPPEEYMERVNIFNRIGMQRVLEEERRAKERGYRGIGYYPALSESSYRSILEGIRAGNEIDVPNLVYRNGMLENQEGFHRALVARDIGIDKIPVQVIGEMPSSFNRALNLRWNENLTGQVKAINALKGKVLGGVSMVREATTPAPEPANKEFKVATDYVKKLFNLKITDFVVGGAPPIKSYGEVSWCDKDGERIVCHLLHPESAIHEGVHAFFEEYHRRNKVRAYETLEEVTARIVEYNIKGKRLPICYPDLKNELINERKHYSFIDMEKGRKMFDLKGSIYGSRCVLPEDLQIYHKTINIIDPLRVYNILAEYVGIEKLKENALFNYKYKEGLSVMVKEQTDNGFKANPNLISKEAARAAYSGTSFEPEKRGEQPVADIQALFDRYKRSTLLTTGALASPKFLKDEVLIRDISQNLQISEEEACRLVPQFRAIAEMRINKEEVESVKELFGIDLEQEAHKLGIDLADYAIIKAGNRVFLQHKTIVQKQYEIKSPAGFMKKQEEETQEKLREAQRRKALTVPPSAKPAQSIQEIKQQVLNSIQAAKSVEELQPILKGIGFLPLPEAEKQQLMDAYQKRYSTLLSEIPFGAPIKIEEKPRVIGAPTKQELFEAEQRRKAEEARKIRVQPTLIGGVVTAKRLEMFEPGAVEKARAEAEARKRIEQLGLPFEVHPVIKRLAASTQDVLRFGSKRGRATVEDLVLERYVKYCPPGTIINNMNVPKVTERWWVYPGKLRACITQVEQKLAGAGAGMVKEGTKYLHALLAAEINKMSSTDELNKLIPRIKVSDKLADWEKTDLIDRITYRKLEIQRKHPASRETSVVREATQYSQYTKGAQAIRDVMYYYRDGRLPLRGVLYRARDGTYFVEAQDGQIYSAMGWEDVAGAGIPPAGGVVREGYRYRYSV